jgi:hypothetical protein
VRRSNSADQPIKVKISRAPFAVTFFPVMAAGVMYWLWGIGGIVDVVEAATNGSMRHGGFVY